MQRLVESTASRSASNSRSGSGGGSKGLRMKLFLMAVGAFAFAFCFLNPAVNTTEIELGEPIASPPRGVEKPAEEEGGNHVIEGSPKPPALVSVVAPPPLHADEVPFLEPWGYNADRNVPRWKAISESIRNDPLRPFTLVDYGADQGYFSASVAHFFLQSYVFALELGGSGGEIWNKNKPKKKDVLTIQEEHIDGLNLRNMMICQARMHQDHFVKFNEMKAKSDYQLMLSVFHWFDLPDRPAFEKAVTDLFRNAHTTFIELPTIGDNSELIRKQVGYSRFSKWYDGRSDVGQILQDAADAHHLPVKITKILESKWIRWTREVYRVDLIEDDYDKEGKNVVELFHCEDRRKVYGCESRARFSNCRDIYGEGA